MKKALSISLKYMLGSLAGLGLVFILFYFFYFLRDPLRQGPNSNELFVSPANGKIIAIIRQEDLHSNEESILYKNHNEVINDWTEGFSWWTLVSIMMTPLDVHYQRAPIQADLIEQKYQEGKFYNAMKKRENMKSTFQNEYNSMLFQTSEKEKFRIIQIAGFLARRIVSFIDQGDSLKQGDTIGLIKLGSQVSVILDHNFEVLAKEGDYVIDGETIIAQKK